MSTQDQIDAWPALGVQPKGFLSRKVKALLALLALWSLGLTAGTILLKLDIDQFRNETAAVVARQEGVNQYVFQIFSEMSVWARSVEERLASGRPMEGVFTPAQYDPMVNRRVSYLRIADDDNYIAVAFQNTNLLCIINTRTGQFHCEVP